MGKRKRRVDKNKAPSHPDITSYVPPVDLQFKEALHMDAPDSSVRKSPGRESPHQNPGSSHRILLRHSRHPFGHHYSRRSSNNYSDASPTNWKGPLYDARLSFKSESKDISTFPYRGSRIFQKPERIRSNSSVENSVSGDMRKMECRICQKRLRKNPFIFESSSSTDLSVVAVLFCGHVYHAECLERETSHEDCQDPPCPLCVNQTSCGV